jgi:hypothetical protein
MTTLTQAQFARHLGVDRAHITRLKHAGRLVLTPAGQVDVEASEARIAATADPAKDHVAQRHAASRADGATEKKPVADTSAIGNSYAAARAVKEKYFAMQAKLDYERSVGELIKRDAAAFAMTDAMATLRMQLVALPAIWGDQLAALTDSHEIRVLLEDQINAALEEAAVAMHRIPGENAHEN